MNQVVFIFKKKDETWTSPPIIRAALESTYFGHMLHFSDAKNEVVINYDEENDLGYHPLQALRVLEDLNTKFLKESVPLSFDLIRFFGVLDKNLSVNEDIPKKLFRKCLLRYAMKQMRKKNALDVVYNEDTIYHINTEHGFLRRCAWHTLDNEEDDELPNLMFYQEVLIEKWDGTFMDGFLPSYVLYENSLYLRFPTKKKRYVVSYFFLASKRWLSYIFNLFNNMEVRFVPNSKPHSLIVRSHDRLYQKYIGECGGTNCVCYYDYMDIKKGDSCFGAKWFRLQKNK